ncbi:MAG TPA: DUF4910 domain-containing protein, partial [Anaerolineae bacterium]|nr:DUF4910 domain-containing protein [Anaerolineae bacterium]
MFKKTLRLIQSAYSGEAAKQYVAAISRYHRIQASPGYRAAAEYVARSLQDAGLDVHVLRFPATETTRYWTLEAWQEWECREATLDLLPLDGESERLCDYRAVPISLIQRSASFDGNVEIVLLEDGTHAQDYEGADVAGKAVLTNGRVQRVYELAVAQRNAVGILFDGMDESAPGRGPLDLPDARQYTSFWWARGQRKCFGFVLTPRQGQRLRQLLREKKPGAVQVRVHVDSRFYDGTMELVEAVIPGTESDDELLMIAHLCHPQPSANDNASGAAAAIEAVLTLYRLIDQGALPSPRRGLRFLWVPEMSGTYAWLSNHEDHIPHLVAGINLDMVGQDQAQTGSVWTLERPPEAMASFAPDLLERIREALWEQPNQPLSVCWPPRAPVRHAVVPFSGGSDHYILSDPTVGVPTPMLIQWPDRFYHTSADTVDKTDPTSLYASGVVAATYVYWLANSGAPEVVWLGEEMNTRFSAWLSRIGQETITAGLAAETQAQLMHIWEQLERTVAFRRDRHLAALNTLARLAPDEELDQEIALLRSRARVWANEERGRVRAILLQQAARLGLSSLADPTEPIPEEGTWQCEAAATVPERLYRGPAALHGPLARLSDADREVFREWEEAGSQEWQRARRVAEYWADGQRTITDIVQLVELETGWRQGEKVWEYFQWLEQLG